MKISNLRIGVRLGLGFGLVLALMVALALIGMSRMAQINASLDGIVNDNNVKIKTVTEMRQSVMSIGLATRNMALASDADQRAQELDRIADDRDEYKAYVETLDHMLVGDAGKAVLEKIAAARAATDTVTDQVLALLLKDKQADAIALLVDQVRPNQRKWIDTLDEMVRRQEKQADAAAEAALRSYRSARLLTGIITALALLLGTAAAWTVTRSITTPLSAAVALARRVALGDLSGEVLVTSRDEAGQLMAALKDMHDSLVAIVAQVRSGTNTIALASSEISAGNADLSARTEQQASALEETASSMEQLMATVQQNAEHARQADKMARSASEVAVRGGAVVAQVVHTMGSINTSAKRIVDIISVIDGIAFQTNILALNAAVEAARAGEQGRGFAVVASEVRSLAHRSAGAAKEIKTLIEDSVRQVGAGSVLVDQAGVTMQDIVASVQRMTDIMDDITAASDEQTLGIAQINQAVAQMDSVTQQNAALVEEAAAAAEALQEQAASLAGVVDVFKLDGAARRSKRRRRRGPARAGRPPSWPTAPPTAPAGWRSSPPFAVQPTPTGTTIMKIPTLSLALCTLLLTAGAQAATPPGHPAAAVVNAELPQRGKVISTIDASQYTYIEVAQDKKVLWLAAPALALKKNNIIRFEDGAEMTNFHSKSLNRTFPSIRFVNRVVVTTEKN